LGRVLGRVLAVVSVGLISKKIIQNTIAQEKAVAQLNAVLKSTGRFTEEASQSLQDYASALQQTTTFSDEAIIGAENLLLTYDQIGGESFPRATKAALDMSVALGQDLKSSTIQIAKALNDPKTQLTFLNRTGIAFTQTQREMIFAMQDAGNMAGAQAIILEELEKRYEGSAEAARNTLGGALKGLSDTFNDLLEGKGGGVKGATAAINDLNKALLDPDVQQGIESIVSGIFRMGEAALRSKQLIGFLADETKAAFGSIADDDITRLEDRLEELNSGFTQKAFIGPGGWIGRWLFNDDPEAIKAEIADIEARLEAARAKQEEDVAQRHEEAEEDPGAAVAANIGRVEGETAATEQLNETKEKTIELIRVEADLRQTSRATDLLADLEFENSLIGLSNQERAPGIGRGCNCPE
jgi:uncharacterized protein YjgD (DUF1641 family)